MVPTTGREAMAAVGGDLVLRNGIVALFILTEESSNGVGGWDKRNHHPARRCRGRQRRRQVAAARTSEGDVAFLLQSNYTVEGLAEYPCALSLVALCCLPHARHRSLV